MIKPFSCFANHLFGKTALLLVFIVLGTACAPLALANAIYSYTGTPYTLCVGTYVSNCSSFSLTGNFDTTLSLSQLENLNDFVIPTSDIASFSFTDGFEASLNQTTAAFSFFEISTDSHGDITNWAIVFLNEVLPTNTEISGVTAIATVANVDDLSGNDFTFDCASGDTPPFCPAILNSGGLTTKSGVWSLRGTAPTPELPSLLLLGTGLLGLGLFVRRLA